jgi:hypothetical protein
MRTRTSTPGRVPSGRLRLAVLGLLGGVLLSTLIQVSAPLEAAGVGATAAPTEVVVIGRFGGARIRWTRVTDETELTAYEVTAVPVGTGASGTCTAAPGETSCEILTLTYGKDYAFTARAVYGGTSPSSAAAAAVTAKAGISMQIEARVNGTATVLTTPRVDNDVFVQALVPGTLTGGDFDLWACPDETIIPRDNQSSALNGECVGPNIQGQSGDSTTFTLNADKYGTFCNWLIILHDYSAGAHSNWIGPLLGADGTPIEGCPNTLALAPGTDPLPPVQPASVPSGPTWVQGPDGIAPTVPTSIGLLQRTGGTAETLTLSQTGPNTVRYSGDGIRVTFTGAPGSNSTLGLIADENGQVECEVCAFLASGGVIEAWMFSEPRLVAAWRVEDLPCQRFTIPVGAPLDGGGPIPAGSHTLQLVLPTASGLQAVNVGVTVGPLRPVSVRAGEGPSGPIRSDATVLLGALALTLLTVQRLRSRQRA